MSGRLNHLSSVVGRSEQKTSKEQGRRWMSKQRPQRSTADDPDEARPGSGAVG
uniref:Uncharacterized protein n=1 Tax=Arundo donax TaxID=35708 RepID=A0A0A9B3V7_ARUDO